SFIERMSYLGGLLLARNLRTMKSLRRLIAFLVTTCLVTASHAFAGTMVPVSGPSLLLPGATHGLDAGSSSPASADIASPGPLRSFLRMAGISQKASSEEVLPLLAAMVGTRGYVKGKPTEFLVLVKRYLQQASELVALAGPHGVIRVSN